MSALDSPFTVLAASFIVQWLAAYAGDLFRKKVRPLKADARDDFDIIRTAALTLLFLIIGFSFAMAVSRYDQRRNYEESEANAIGTEYLRADFLPVDIAPGLRDLLKRYLEKRIAYYTAIDERVVEQIDAETAKLQAELWSTTARFAIDHQTQVIALVVSGMNDVLNSQGYTQAAWWNRIPLAAWLLMGLIAVSCNVLFGYGEHRTGAVVLILPLIVSISLFLIADIDNPRAGMIRVPPHNLIALYQTMNAH
jgi:hypothetical protein